MFEPLPPTKANDVEFLRQIIIMPDEECAITLQANTILMMGSALYRLVSEVFCDFSERQPGDYNNHRYTTIDDNLYMIFAKDGR